MSRIVQAVKGGWAWLTARTPQIAQAFLVLVVIGLALIVIGTLREQIATIATNRPVATAVWTAVVCVLSGFLIAWRSKLPQKWEDYRDLAIIVLTVLTAVGIGVYLLTSSVDYADKAFKATAFRVATGWSFAYFAGGFIIGFLFGIPRVLQGNNPSGAATNGGATANKNGTGYQQLVNTNLEQISDWLTKIIVGLGLVELRTMPERIHKASLWMAKSIGGNRTDADLEQVASFSCAFIIYFAIVGFLAGYLMTRLYLAGAFRRADDASTTLAPATFSLTAGGDDDRIRNFWKPQGQVNQVNEERIRNWLKTKQLDVSIPMFLAGAEYGAQRTAAITELNIP